MNNIIIELIADGKQISKVEYPNNNEGQIKLYNYLKMLKLSPKFSYRHENNSVIISSDSASINISNFPNSNFIEDLLNRMVLESVYKDKPKYMYLTTKQGTTEFKYMEYLGHETLFVIVSTDTNNNLTNNSQKIIDGIIDREFEYWKPYFISGKQDSTLKLFYDGQNVKATDVVTNYIMPKVNKMRTQYLDWNANPLERVLKNDNGTNGKFM